MKRALAILTLPAVLALGACGGDDEKSEQKILSRQELVSKGDALCRGYNEKQAELGRPSNTRELAAQGDELLPLQEKIGTRFKRLRARPRDRAALNRMIAVQEELGGLNRKRYAAAERGDRQAVEEATDEFRATYPRYVKAARALGFKVCATG
jgi:hypothetical protein